MIIAIFTAYNYIHIKNINEKKLLSNKIEIQNKRINSLIKSSYFNKRNFKNFESYDIITNKEKIFVEDSSIYIFSLLTKHGCSRCLENILLMLNKIYREHKKCKVYGLISKNEIYKFREMIKAKKINFQINWTRNNVLIDQFNFNSLSPQVVIVKEGIIESVFYSIPGDLEFNKINFDWLNINLCKYEE